jgi:hypothetical protein
MTDRRERKITATARENLPPGVTLTVTKKGGLIYMTFVRGADVKKLSTGFNLEGRELQNFAHKIRSLFN